VGKVKRASYSFNPDWTMFPGEHVLEWLTENHKTQAWLAKKCRRPVEQVNRLIKGHIRLTERWAIELAKATKRHSPEMWYRLEADYRIGLAMGKKRV
jgi:plasmid maintenance system antidote protein VapI